MEERMYKSYEYYADVCIVGGGMAGCSAAVTSARQGLKTILVEKGCTLGGLATNGYVPQIAGGVEGFCYEFVKRLDCEGSVRRLGSEDGPYYVLPTFDAEMAKIILEEMVLEAGVKILYNTTFVAAEKTGGTIENAVFVFEGEPVIVRAHIYVDATGTGDLAYSCGVPYDMGSPEYGGYNMSTSQGIRFAGADLVKYGAAQAEYAKQSKTPLVYAIEEEAIKAGRLSRHIANRGNGFICIPLPGTAMDDAEFVTFSFHSYGCVNDDPENVTAQITQQHADMKAFAQFLKKEVPGFEHVRITGLGGLPGFREGRRFECGYRLTDEDFASGRKFADGIARYPEIAATHHPTDHDAFFIRQVPVSRIEGSAINAAELKEGKAYELGKRFLAEKDPRDWCDLPYRSMVPLGTDNLLNAGRCLSAEFHASSALRVIGPATETGMAAAIAAKMSIDSNIKPCDVDGALVKAKMKDLGVDLSKQAPGHKTL